MANSATNIYNVLECPTLSGRIRVIKGSIDTTSSDLVVWTVSASNKSVYLKGHFYSEGTAGNVTYKQRSLAKTGTVATTNASATITGTDTVFTTEYAAGDEIVITDGNTLTVQSVDSDTQITATGNATSTVSGKAHRRQETLVTPEMAANQGILVPVQKGQWILATEEGYSLVLNSSAAISSFLLHVQEADSTP